jgi:hypothetical protein
VLISTQPFPRHHFLPNITTNAKYNILDVISETQHTVLEVTIIMEVNTTGSSDVMMFYVFDTSSGIVCTGCGTPVSTPTKSTYYAAIRQHEATKQQILSARRPTTDDEVKDIVSRFSEFIEESVQSVHSCLPCKKTTNECFLSYVGTCEPYDNCSACEVLTTNKHIHNSKKCISLGRITETKMGVKNKYWTKSNPKPIIVEDFDIGNDKSKQFIHRSFQVLWNEKNSATIDDESTNEDKNAFLAMMQKQADIFLAEQHSQIIQPINNALTPNKYVTSLQWDIAMSQCSFKVIDGMKFADRFGEYEDGIGMVLNRIDEALWYALECGKSIQPSHQIFRTIGTKDGGATDHLFSLVHKEATWKKYFQIIGKLCLILFRLKIRHLRYLSMIFIRVWKIEAR